EACRVLVIGDTPRDVAAARAIGAACVAVATGWTSADDLRAAGADVVVEHLEEAAALAALLATG
ncbi:MAG: HAD hydrolase-like protein, partial [Myxococcales bacterium]|nr:HAD hydrolase-like protein [Myxococcales bacterium]